MRQAGFTLLEVLVALVLLGLLLGGLAQGVRFGLTAWQAQERQAAAADNLDAVDRSLRLLVEGMEAGTGQSQVNGTGEQLTFIGRLPAAVLAGRRADMTLSLAAQGRLVLHWRPHRHERAFGTPPRPTETPLIEGLDRVEIAYWRKAATGILGGWVDRWNQPGLPGLIRLRLIFPPGDHRHWPDIVVAPMVEPLTN